MNRPNLRYSLTIAFAILLTTLSSTTVCLAWSLAPQPIEGVLLLKNSNILRGKIQKVGKNYDVHLPNGKLQIRAQQVETVCEDIEAAYQFRRKQRGGSSADTHLELAGWCLRHDLFDHAEVELDEAATIDAEHRRLAYLRRHLTQSRKLALREQQQSKGEAESVAPPPVDLEDLEKAPKWARALFVRQVQPLIVHSCATSGCHQAGDAEPFQINRLALDGAGHPGVTLRNLAQTLHQVDFESAEHSALLAMASKAHGNATKSEPLPAHKLHVLNTWVEQLAVAHQQASSLQTVPLLAEVATSPTTPTLQLNPPQRPTPPLGVRTASYAPADPFDPSVFNARYGAPSAPEQSTAAAKQATSTEALPLDSASLDATAPPLLEPSDTQLIPLPQVE